MHDAEANAIAICSQCSEEISPELERAFLLGPDEILCYECAVARGAIYDDVNETWVVAPDSSEVHVIADASAPLSR
jgi:hypothetical protein